MLGFKVRDFKDGRLVSRIFAGFFADAQKDDKDDGNSDSAKTPSQCHCETLSVCAQAPASVIARQSQTATAIYRIALTESLTPTLPVSLRGVAKPRRGNLRVSTAMITHSRVGIAIISAIILREAERQPKDLKEIFRLRLKMTGRRFFASLKMTDSDSAKTILSVLTRRLPRQSATASQ